MSTRTSTLMIRKHSSTGNPSQTSITFYSTPQEFAQAERLRPTTSPTSSYERLSSPEKTFRLTAATHTNLEYKTTLCRNYASRGRCAFGESCKFVHDRTMWRVSEQRTRQGDRASYCDNCVQDMNRRGYSGIRPHLAHEHPPHYTKNVPRRSGDANARGAFHPFNYPAASSPPGSQPNLRRLRTLSVTDPLALDSGVELGLSDEEQSGVVEDFSVTKIPLSFKCHAIRVRPPVKGAGSQCRLFAPRPCPPPSFLQSRAAEIFDPPHVESPTLTESSIPSSDFHSPIVPPGPRSNPLKDLVDELPPFPFVSSPLSDIKRKARRSLTYEDLPKGASEKCPLRRQKVRGVPYLGPFRGSGKLRELMRAASIFRVCPASSPLEGRMNITLIAASARAFPV